MQRMRYKLRFWSQRDRKSNERTSQSILRSFLVPLTVKELELLQGKIFLSQRPLIVAGPTCRRFFFGWASCLPVVE